MSLQNEDFETLEQQSATNFVKQRRHTEVEQVVYQNGIINCEKLSKYLRLHKKVEEILSSGLFHLTTLRAGINCRVRQRII